MRPRYKKITVKVGSNVLTKPDGTLNDDHIAHLVDQIASLHKQGVEVVLVSSGAVAAGRSQVVPKRKRDTLSSRQLWSAVGQVKLMATYARCFQRHGVACAQVLTTKENFSDRTHYLNMKNCVATLIENKVVPIVNENDAISVTELMFTDNDELSGLIAAMERSEALVILSNVDGIYDAPPDRPDAKIIREITQASKTLAREISARKSNFGRGGMLTKYHIARRLSKSGIAVHIANGATRNILLKIMDASADVEHTRFAPGRRRVSTLKHWISHSESFARGEVFVNEGARKALASDRATSLLFVGVFAIVGTFQKGDIVRLKSEDGALIGVGRSEYCSETATRLLGKRNKKALVHYDYLYLY